jgi:hypothetical protein
MKSIKVVSLLFAMASSALVHAHEEQNEAETRPQQANEHSTILQRSMPEEVEIGEFGADVGRVDLGQFQQLLEAENKVEEVEVDVSKRLSDTFQG